MFEGSGFDPGPLVTFPGNRLSTLRCTSCTRTQGKSTELTETKIRLICWYWRSHVEAEGSCGYWRTRMQVAQTHRPSSLVWVLLKAITLTPGGMTELWAHFWDAPRGQTTVSSGNRLTPQQLTARSFRCVLIL